MTSLLQIEGLEVGLGERGPAILSDVSLSVAASEVVGVVGESGSGKSILALTVMGLLPPAVQPRAGSIFLQGKDLLPLGAEERRALCGSAMAMIFQEPMTSLNPVMRVGEQIAEVYRWHQQLPDRAVREKCLALLEKVEIPDARRRLDAYPHELSGGMRQRVMIAMALAAEPQLLIADEPTTALDVTIQAQILHLLRRLQSQQSMGVLLITHDLGVIAEMCDRVVVMYAGRVVESASTMDLFDAPLHPYTQGLMAARPTLGDTGQQRLRSIDGTVPGVGQLPAGCAFAPRCPQARDACRQERPALQAVTPSRQVACWLVEARA